MLNVSRPLWGPAFGTGPDLHLLSPTGKLNVDGRPGCSRTITPASFEIAEVGPEPPPVDSDFASNSALLAGGCAAGTMGASARVFDAVESPSTS